MEQYELGAAAARERIAALRREAADGGWPGLGGRQPGARAEEGRPC